jgi:hypothetical protein
MGCLFSLISQVLQIISRILWQTSRLVLSRHGRLVHLNCPVIIADIPALDQRFIPQDKGVIKVSFLPDLAPSLGFEEYETPPPQ